MLAVALTSVVPESMASTVWSALVRRWWTPGVSGTPPGKVEGLGEVFALDPELVLAGNVAGVVADLECGDDDGADGPGFWLLCLGGEANTKTNAEGAKAAEVRGGVRWGLSAHGLAPALFEVLSV